MFETLKDCAQESSQAWNNAGTGHAANCELNYTPQRPDGSVDISKALTVNTEFDRLAPAVGLSGPQGRDPRSARLHPSLPAHELRLGATENVAFLKTRYREMSAHHCYQGMEYSEDRRADRRMGAADHRRP